MHVNLTIILKILKSKNLYNSEHLWKLVQQWTYVHTSVEYSCSRKLVVLIVIKLGKTLKISVQMVVNIMNMYTPILLIFYVQINLGVQIR